MLARSIFGCRKAPLRDLSEQEVLALAISSEERTARSTLLMPPSCAPNILRRLLCSMAWRQRRTSIGVG